MLWDPSKDKPKVEPLSLEGLVQWLETQDPKTKYDYTNTFDCLWTRYQKYLGVEKVKYSGFPYGVGSVLNPRISKYTITYGAALKRGKEALAKQRR